MCEITEAITISCWFLALSTVCTCRLATTSGGGGGTFSVSTERLFLPGSDTSNLAHVVGALFIAATPSSLSQHGPITLRLTSSRSRHEVLVPKSLRKVWPSLSCGSAGCSAE